MVMVVCSNMMIMGVIKVINEENKKILDDLLIIGFDKNEFLDMVGLSIIYLEDCFVELGIKVMNMFCDIIDKNGKNEV